MDRISEDLKKFYDQVQGFKMDNYDFDQTLDKIRDDIFANLELSTYFKDEAFLNILIKYAYQANTIEEFINNTQYDQLLIDYIAKVSKLEN